jgi:hypothetical protein
MLTGGAISLKVFEEAAGHNDMRRLTSSISALTRFGVTQGSGGAGLHSDRSSFGRKCIEFE